MNGHSGQLWVISDSPLFLFQTNSTAKKNRSCGQIAVSKVWMAVLDSRDSDSSATSSSYLPWSSTANTEGLTSSPYCTTWPCSAFDVLFMKRHPSEHRSLYRGFWGVLDVDICVCVCVCTAGCSMSIKKKELPFFPVFPLPLSPPVLLPVKAKVTAC